MRPARDNRSIVPGAFVRATTLLAGDQAPRAPSDMDDLTLTSGGPEPEPATAEGARRALADIAAPRRAPPNSPAGVA